MGVCGIGQVHHTAPIGIHSEDLPIVIAVGLEQDPVWVFPKLSLEIVGFIGKSRETAGRG
jgi:hypothetical protein